MSISEEDDALNQVMNHGSVHHAEFLDEDVVFALSHDEVFSIYHLTDPDSNSGRDPLSFGDLRTRLECDYVVDVLSTRGNKGAFVAAGSHAT